MSMMKRISMIFRAKANKALDKAEDPRETLDYSYQQQVEMLTKVRRGVADVATSRKRVELQINQLQTQSDKLTEQAQKALVDGPRGPGPRGADPQVRAAPADVPTSRPSTPSSRARRRSSPSPPSGCRPRSSPSAPARRRSRRPTPPPRRRPGSTRRSPGISEEMGDVGMAIQRAEDKTAQMQARAGAIDELIASGALDDASSISGGDDISRELESMSSQADVEAELAALKGGSAAGHRRRRRPRAEAARPRPAESAPSRRRSRRGSRHDRPDPRRGAVRGRRRPSSSRSTSSTAASRPRSRPVTRRLRAPRLAALLDGVRRVGTAARRTTPSWTPT